MRRDHTEIETVGYRNCKYVGQATKNQKGIKLPEGFGMLIDDLFITCVGQWQQQQSNAIPRGPVLLVYPKGEIFFASNYPRANGSPGLWCFTLHDQEIRLYGNAENGSNFAVINGEGDHNISVSWLVTRDGGLKIEKEYYCENEQELWQTVSKILRSQVPQSYRSLDTFVSEKLSGAPSTVINVPVQKNKSFYGITDSNGEGAGFVLNKNASSISELGFYEDIKGSRFLTFGKKIIPQPQADLIQEGRYLDQQGEQMVFGYYSDEKRPPEARKQMQKYFRKSTQFMNHFIHLQEADDAFKEMRDIMNDYLRLHHFYNGQRIIEDGPERERARKIEEEKKQTARLQRQRQKNKQPIHKAKDGTIKQYDLNEAKAAIEKDISRRRGKHGTDRVYYQTRRSPERHSSPTIIPQSQKNRTIHQNYNYEPALSPRKSSPRKYKYTDEEGRASHPRKSSPIRKINVRESPRKISSYNENRVRQFTIQDEYSTLLRQKQYLESERSQRGYDRVLDEELDSLKREKILQLELQKERQLIESDRLLQILKLREMEQINTEEDLRIQQLAQTNHLKLNQQRNLATFGALGVPLTETYSLNQPPAQKFSKKYQRQNYTYTDETKGNLTSYTPNRGRNRPARSPSPFNPRTTSSRNYYKYVE